MAANGSRFEQPVVGLLWSILGGTLLAACGGDPASAADGAGGAGTTGPPAKFSEIYPMIFPNTTNARCNFCHSMPPTDKGNGMLHMGDSQAMAYDALVGKNSQSTRCMNRPLVVAGQPDMSLLYLKVSLPAPPCGSRMPLGGTPFNDMQIGMIRSWIAAGAMND
jgi:hypothetical protein